jgi:peptidoglycan/xylan/chitin deacetylase (PgdA/CDA1 family)
MFHHFHDSLHPEGQGAISSDQFNDIIHFIGKDRILSPKEWLDKSVKNKLELGDICLTFDDNLRCQFDVAYPVLKANGLQAFWFINTYPFEGKVDNLELFRHFRTTQYKNINDFYEAFFATAVQSVHGKEIESGLKNFDPETYLKDFSFYTPQDKKFRFIRDKVLGPQKYNEVMDYMIDQSGYDRIAAGKNLWMEPKNIQTLESEGHLIGLHSHSHPTQFANLSALKQEEEIKTNLNFLTDIIGKKPRCMSHPCNSYNLDSINLLKENGIELGFRSNMVEVNNDHNLEHPREDHVNVLALIKV